MSAPIPADPIAAVRAASTPRRWLAVRLVALFATDADGRVVLLDNLPPAGRWMASSGIRAAERLLRVPDGTVRAATAELRAERAL